MTLNRRNETIAITPQQTTQRGAPLTRHAALSMIPTMTRRFHSFASAGLVWLAVCIPAAADSLVISGLTPIGNQLTFTVQTTGSVTNQQLLSSE